MSLDFKHKLAFIDVETSGLDPQKQEIIELACIVCSRGNSSSDLTIEKELEVKIKMEHPELAEPEALRVNGYNEMDWVFAYTLPQALELLNKETKDAVFVAHNVCFDWSFIEAAYKKAGMEHGFHNHKIDTLSIAFAKLQGTDARHLSLRSLCERFGVTNEKAHTALADTRALVEVYKKLMELK